MSWVFVLVKKEVVLKSEHRTESVDFGLSLSRLVLETIDVELVTMYWDGDLWSTDRRRSQKTWHRLHWDLEPGINCQRTEFHREAEQLTHDLSPATCVRNSADDCGPCSMDRDVHRCGSPASFAIGPFLPMSHCTSAFASALLSPFSRLLFLVLLYRCLIIWL